MIELVLATDMGEHMAIVSRYVCVCVCVCLCVCVCVVLGMGGHDLRQPIVSGKVRSKVSEEQ